MGNEMAGGGAEIQRERPATVHDPLSSKEEWVALSEEEKKARMDEYSFESGVLKDNGVAWQNLGCVWMTAEELERIKERRRTRAPDVVEALTEAMKAREAARPANCTYCGVFKPRTELKRCGRCKSEAIRYCGRDCQRAHWSRHKRHHCTNARDPVSTVNGGDPLPEKYQVRDPVAKVELDAIREQRASLRPENSLAL